MKTLLLDLETYSERDLKTYGTWAYAEVAEVMLLAYAWDDGPVEVVEFPPANFMQSLIDQADQVVIQNSHFDRTVLGFMQVRIPTDKIFDTMVVALLHSLPGSLDKLCQVLAVPFDMVKDKAGKRLIQLFCKPRPKKQKIRRATKETHPTEWAEFVEYARMDIVSMREVYKRLPKVNWTPAEQALWRLDQTINDRGVQIDLDLAHAALRAAKEAGERLAVQAKDMTDGAVPSATQRDALLTYLRDVMGVDVEDLRKGTLAALLKTDVPDDVRELLEVRLQAAATSPAKYRVLTRATSEDGRLRGTLQFAGASRTGRFVGRLVQPQNLPRPSLKQPMIDAGIEALKLGIEGDLFNDVMELCSSAVRGAIVAAPGRKLVIADLSNIEGRMLAWLAGEERKIEAFRTFDRGDGYDIYKVAYAGAFGVSPADVTRDQRQIGKVMELMLGYAGGVGAFLTGALTYGFNIETMAENAYGTLPPAAVKQAGETLAWRKERGLDVYGLSDRAFIVCEVFKLLWREAHPATVRLWHDSESGMRNAIRNPGEVYRAGKLAFRRMGGWLRVRLPSGRYLCYLQPEVDDDGRLSYMGQNQYTRRWERLDTYGGKLCIAKGTPVLTEAGWVPIEQVSTTHRVWDGIEWVQHDGLAVQGIKGVIQAHGVWMTPDHEVLTTRGWVRASQSEKYSRAPCRLPDGAPVLTEQRSQISVGHILRLREPDREGRLRVYEVVEAGCESVLRVQERCVYPRGDHNARNVEAQGVRGVAVDVGSVPTSDSPSMEKLRRARDIGVRVLARVLKLLGRYGADIRRGFDAGPRRQRRELHPGKLSVDYPQTAGPKHAVEHNVGHAVGPHDRSGGGREVGFELHDAPVSCRTKGCSAAPVFRPGHLAEVFDLVNCGPRTRFVVADENGNPLIVHNCENATQAASRDILAAGLMAAEAAGYNPVLHVHDEILCETPDDPSFNADGLAALMSRGTQWSVGLPLAAAGFETYRYRKDD